MDRYRLEQIDDHKRWDRFLGVSENGTVFSCSAFFSSLQQPVDLWECYKGKTLCAGILIPTDDSSRSALMHNYLAYGGIVFALSQSEQNRSGRISEHFAITRAVAEHLSAHYRDIHIRLCPYQRDIRPYLWVNYGRNLPRYAPYVRYTTVVDVRGLAQTEETEEGGIFMKISTMRRRSIRRARKNNVITKERYDVELFLDFYRKTLERQGLRARETPLQEMCHIIESLYSTGTGRMFVAYDASGDPGSAAFFGMDYRRAYYIFGSSDPKQRHTDTGTAVLWDAFRFLSMDGIREVDLVGVNSPNRGSFKLSFGGNLLPYYELTLTR